jgi:hypothetical protein
MRYLLDTNIISNITKPNPSESLLAWMAHSFDGSIPPASNSRAPMTFSESFQPEGSATTTNFVLT